jgi:hypothetical protein
MEESLIFRLRNSHAIGARKFFAIKLAKSGSDWGTEELKRMAEGGVRKKGILGCLFYHHYHEEDQLNAIIALGESSNQIALDYLKRIYNPIIDKTEKNNFGTVNYSYTSAPRHLKYLLDYTESGVSGIDSLVISNREDEIHSIFTKAIGKLERDLNKR